MRAIPSELLERVKKKWQVPAENADPAMKVYLSRGFINEMFQIFTIQEGLNLSAVDVTAKRLDASQEPGVAYAMCVDAGTATIHSKPLPYDDQTGWGYEMTVASGVTDVAIEFDGYWERDYETTRFNLVTEEYPWAFYVQSGSLYAKYWTDDPILLATGVSKISAVRGWKSITVPLKDQGLIIAYLVGGVAYYRNRCEQVDGSESWEVERPIENTITNCVNIAAFRTNDFRVGFALETATGEIHHVVTQRDWAGMAIPPEFLLAKPVSVEAVLTPIEYVNLTHIETIDIAPQEPVSNLLWAMPENDVVSIENIANGEDNWGFILIVELAHGITSADTSNFTLTASGFTAQINSIEWLYGKTYRMNTSDFNNAFGDLTLNFLGSGNTKGEAGQDMTSFSGSFTPVNLVPTFIPLPEVEVIYNE